MAQKLSEIQNLTTTDIDDNESNINKMASHLLYNLGWFFKVLLPRHTFKRPFLPPLFVLD